MATTSTAASAPSAWLRWVESGTPTVAAWQKYFGVTPTGPTNMFWHAIFTMGAGFGNEMFFILFLPVVGWAWDWLTFRRIIILWGLSYYVGHVWKDLACLPRPPPLRNTSGSPTTVAVAAATSTSTSSSGKAGDETAPTSKGGNGQEQTEVQGVVRLENHYEHEYGMPSTHCMNAVTMPWYLLLLSLDRFMGPVLLPIAAAAFWTVSCVFSRFYMGVHSPADMIMGSLLGAVLLALGVFFGESLDHWIVHSPHALWVIPLVAIVMVAVYPRPSKPTWVSSPGDTTLILGVCVGVSAGMNIMTAIHRSVPGAISIAFSWHSALTGVISLLVGYAVLFLSRAVAKAAGVALLSRLLTPAYGPADDMSIQPQLDSARHAHEKGGEATLSRPAVDTNVEEDPAADGGRADPTDTTAGLRHRRPQVSPSSVASDPGSSPMSLSEPVQRSSSAATPISAPSGKVLIPPGRRYAIELPVKLFTYAVIGFNATITVPYLFHYLGLWEYGL